MSSDTRAASQDRTTRQPSVRILEDRQQTREAASRSASEPDRGDRLRSTFRANARWLLASGTCFALIGLWQASYALDLIDPLYTSAPTEVWQAGVEYFQSDQVGGDVRASATAFGWGYVIALFSGAIIGVLIGWYKYLRFALEPLVAFLYATPRVALVPMFIIWFGIGVESKIALVVALAIFPMIINTASAVQAIDRDLVRVASVYGASTQQLFRTIVVPSVLPAVMTGARLAVGLGLIGVIVGELSVSSSGVGHRMVQAASFFRTDLVLLLVVLVAATGAALSGMLQRLERWLMPWRSGES